MRKNKAKEIIKNGNAVINGWLQIPSTVSAETMAQQGWDSLTIDMQHGLVDYTNAMPMMQVISATEVVPLARVNWNEPGQIMKILDAKMAMIETKEALENLDEIMSTPGLDGIYIGPADLSLAIGEKPGFDKGEDTKAYSEILRILEHAKKNNIFAGIHNGSADYAKKMIEKGFQFVTVGADSRFISAGAKNTVENLKGTVKSELSKAY